MNNAIPAWSLNWIDLIHNTFSQLEVTSFLKWWSIHVSILPRLTMFISGMCIRFNFNWDKIVGWTVAWALYYNWKRQRQRTIVFVIQWRFCNRHWNKSLPFFVSILWKIEDKYSLISKFKHYEVLNIIKSC